MEDAIDALHRPADRPAIGDVARRPLELDSLQGPRVGGAAQQQAQVVAAAGKAVREVGPDEPGATR